MFKTALAVTLSLAVCRVFRIPEPVFAGVAAVICMQPTVLQSFKKGVQRLQATVLGAAVALGMLALVTAFPVPYLRSVAAGVAVMIVLWLCLALKWLDALVLAAATVVVVMIHGETDSNIVIYAAERTLVTGIGIVVASLVNAFVFWPRVEDRFPKRLPQIARQAFDEFEGAVASFAMRDLDGARRRREEWHVRKREFEQASCELSWLEESLAVRQMTPFRCEELPFLMTEVYGIIDAVHQSALSLTEDTITILEDHPEYVVEDARVYRIIEDSLGPASELSRAIVQALNSGDDSVLRETHRDWTADLRRNYVTAVREAHNAPKDVFPLLEVAKVGVELRNYTQRLSRLRALLVENEGVIRLLGAS